MIQKGRRRWDWGRRRVRNLDRGSACMLEGSGEEGNLGKDKGPHQLGGGGCASHTKQ